MSTDVKDKVKLSLAIGILAIIIIMVFMIVLQYQVEGEQNMPYMLSKITIISNAESELNTEDTAENATWNLKINQNNDVYFFIDKNEDTAKDKLIDSVTIQNITVTTAPKKGEIKAFMPNSTEGSLFDYDESYLVMDKLEYKGGTISNPKTLEIGNQGGSALIRFSDANVGTFVSNEDIEIKHDGTLLSRVGASEEDVKAQINFDLIIQVNKIKYKANITIDTPCKGICEEGTTSVEIKDSSKFVFKRVK